MSVTAVGTGVETTDHVSVRLLLSALRVVQRDRDTGGVRWVTLTHHLSRLSAVATGDAALQHNQSQHDVTLTHHLSRLSAVATGDTAL